MWFLAVVYDDRGRVRVSVKGEESALQKERMFHFFIFIVFIFIFFIVFIFIFLPVECEHCLDFFWCEGVGWRMVVGLFLLALLLVVVD
jgi:hypothetical protein